MILTSDIQDGPKGRWTRRKSSSIGRLRSHFVVIIDLIFIICGMLYDIIRTELLDMKILPMKADTH